VHHVLENPALRKEWEEELKQVRLDLQKKRHALYQAMKKGKADLPIEYLLKTTGLFALFDMPLDRVLALRQKEGLYLCDDGRINIASVPINQVDFLAKAISEQMEHLAKS
jgi:aspartate/tyrosine/aromatic aminotransferase